MFFMIYIYICIEREVEGEGEGERDKHACMQAKNAYPINFKINSK